MTAYASGAGYHQSGTIKVIGIGQSLRGDDGAGLAIVRLWVDTFHALHPGVQVELAELPGIGLLSLLDGARFVILVDAVHSTGLPGTIYQLTDDQLASFQAGSSSAHGWGVAETLSLGRTLFPSQMPAKLILIGIEAGELDLGGAFSPEVEASLPDAARLVEQYVATALEQA